MHAGSFAIKHIWLQGTQNLSDRISHDVSLALDIFNQRRLANLLSHVEMMKKFWRYRAFLHEAEEVSQTNINLHHFFSRSSTLREPSWPNSRKKACWVCSLQLKRTTFSNCCSCPRIDISSPMKCLLRWSKPFQSKKLGCLFSKGESKKELSSKIFCKMDASLKLM